MRNGIEDSSQKEMHLPCWAVLLQH